jgi:hypothetical protein
MVQSTSVVHCCRQTPTPPPWTLQTCPVGQPLRPAAVLQPGMQALVVASQTIPELGPPQSESCRQPQFPLVRQSGWEASQSALLVGLHWVQAPPNAPPTWQAGFAGLVQ